MTMILRPNFFCQARSKNFSWKLRAYYGYLREVSTINFHNLQLLCMLWIKYKFSECLAPCTGMELCNGRLSGDGSVLARRHRGHSGTKTFCASPNFVVLRKICFKHMIKTKIYLFKNVFCPLQICLTTGLVLPKLCL